MSEYPRLTEYQLTELERQLCAAEAELASQMHRRKVVKGEALTIVEFKSTEWLRRLLEDVKAYRAALSSPQPEAER